LAHAFYLLVVTLAQLLGILYNQRLLPKKTAGSLVSTVRADLWSLPARFIDATHLVLNLVYHRYRWVRKACVSVKIHFGISIEFARLNSSRSPPRAFGFWPVYHIPIPPLVEPHTGTAKPVANGFNRFTG